MSRCQFNDSLEQHAPHATTSNAARHGQQLHEVTPKECTLTQYRVTQNSSCVLDENDLARLHSCREQCAVLTTNGRGATNFQHGLKVL